MEIDIEKIGELSLNADEILFSPEGEENLIKLFEIKEKIEKAIKEAKKVIEISASKLDKNFKSAHGDRVKVSYRSYGSRFSIDESKADKIPAGLVEKVINYRLVLDEVEKYAEKNGLPEGILQPERPKTISITIKNED